MKNTVLMDRHNIQNCDSQPDQWHRAPVQGAKRYAELHPRYPTQVSFQLRCEKERLAREAIDTKRSEENQRRASHDAECNRLGNDVTPQHILQNTLAVQVAVDPVKCIYRQHGSEEEVHELASQQVSNG